MTLFFSEVEDMMPIVVKDIFGKVKVPQEILYVPCGVKCHVHELPKVYFVEEDEEDEEEGFSFINFL